MNDMMGGIFGITPPDDSPYARFTESPRCAFVSSGRAALACLLANMPRPRRVWVPRMVCDTLLQPLHRAGLSVCRYGCNAQFTPLLPDDVASDDLLILVNYFGLTGKAVEEAAAAAPCSVAVDATTALYADTALPAFYSLRKFLPVPDGGVACAPFALHAQPAETDDSTARLRPMQLRAEQGAAAAYAAAEAAEATLNTPAKRLSPQTRQLLQNIDTAAAARRRCENYRTLHRALGDLNRLELPAEAPSAPLCYPLVSGIPDLRDSLIDAGIALPLYWPEVIAATHAADTENKLARTLLPLPLDQRYTASDMQRLIRLIIG